MKFTCTQENLLKGLSQVVPVTGRNTQLPILQHVLLQAREGALHITGTDLEVGIHTQIGGKVGSEGSCTVDGRKILEYTQQLPHNHPVVISQKNTNILVTTKGFRAQFPTGSVDDFPLLPSSKKDTVITLSAPLICSAIGRTLFSAARDDTRPEIHSVYIQREGSELRVAATDSFRLSEEILPLSDSGENFSILLPVSAAAEVARLFQQQEDIHITPQQNHIMFYGDGIELSSRLIEGSYPDYRQIIPQKHHIRISVDKEEFLRALKTLAVFLPRDSRRIHLSVTPNESEMSLRVGGAESGEGDVKLLFEGDSGQLEILFNIQYLLEGAQHIPSPRCMVDFGGEQDPAVLRPTDENPQYVYVVMPIQA